MSTDSVAEKVSAIYPKIIRLAYKFDKQEPEDLAQSVALNLLSHPERLPRQGQIPTAWVQRVVRNASLDAFRRRKRQLSFDATQQFESDSVGSENTSAPALTTASPEPQIDMRLDLVAALNDLTASQRDTMLMRADGLSYDEIASAENGNVGTIRTRVHYAAKRILGKLKGSSAEDFACKDIPPEQLESLLRDQHIAAMLRIAAVVLAVLVVGSLLLLRLHQ